MMAENNNEIIKSRLEELLGDRILKIYENYGMLNIEVPSNYVLDVFTELYNDEVLSMRFLTDLCGVHYPENAGAELGVIYHLHNLPKNYRLRVKSFFPVENPEIHSLTPLFSSANWMERETYDFYGILFTGHPNLKRILNMDEMDYFPMRKEYALEDETRRDKQDKFFGR